MFSLCHKLNEEGFFDPCWLFFSDVKCEKGMCSTQVLDMLCPVQASLV